MGSQGPGRKRTPSKNGLTAEEDALNVIAKEAEARLAAKRAARAEAREIRMKELERQQKEVSDDEERMSVGSRSNVRVDDRSERDYLEKGSSRASTISGTTLTSLGGTSSRRGSGDTSISADTEASIREIKDSLLEVEEKYRKAMVSNAQLDNEKTNMMYEVDTLKDSLMELEEKLFETRRELEEKSKDLEREKHAHSILQFQFSELKDTLKQSEELLTKHGIVIGPDLTTNGETGEDVGTAEQNSQTASAEIREGSSVLGTHQLKLFKDQQQKDLDDRMQGNQQSSHAPFSSTNTALKANENEDLGDQLNQGIGQLENRPEEPPSSVCDDELTATSPKEKIKSEAHLLEDSRYDTEESERKVHKDKLMETDQQESQYVKPSKEIKEETVSESVSASVHNETDKPDEAVLDDQIKEETPVESVSPSILDETDKPSEAVLDDQLKEEIPVESVFASIHDETDKPGEAVLDDQLKEESVESSQMEKLPKTQVASASNKKKKRKKKNKQKQKLSDKQESDTKLDDKNEIVLSEDNPNPELDGDLEENHEKPLGNDVSETTLITDVPHGDKGTNELDCIEITSTNINAGNAQDKTLLVTDEADSVEMSKSISNSDCPESNNGVLSDDLSNNITANPATIIDDHTEDSTIPDPEPVIFSSELMSSETETSLPHEPSAQSMDTVGVCVESTSKNIENSSLVGVKEEKSHLDCEVEEQNERLQNIDLDGDTHSVDKDNSAHSSSPVMEKVENEAEKVIQEQPIDQPMESQLQDSTGANVGLEEVETQNELDVESFNVPCEKVFDECHVDDTPLIETTEFLVIHEDHLSAIEANQESVVESEASDQEPKVENFQEERSIQNQVKINVQLSEDDEDLQVKSDVVLQELKEKDEEEEDEGESFDFDEMDLEAPSDAPLKNVDQPNEDSALLKENAQEASQEYERNVNDEDQPQEDEHLMEHADHESKTNELKDDGHATENPQTATDVDRCLTGDSQTNSEVKPNDQQHDTPDAFDVHQQASEDVTLSKGVHQSSEMKTRDVSQEMETKDVGQEINSSIHHENKASNISGEQEAAGINKENDRKESKKSGKGKGKGKGKEECKMS